MYIYIYIYNIYYIIYRLFVYIDVYIRICVINISNSILYTSNYKVNISDSNTFIRLLNHFFIINAEAGLFKTSTQFTLKKIYGNFIRFFKVFSDTVDKFIKHLPLHWIGQKSLFVLWIVVCWLVGFFAWWRWSYYYSNASFLCFVSTYILFFYLCVDIFTLVAF